MVGFIPYVDRGTKIDSKIKAIIYHMPWLHPLIWIIYPMIYTPLYNPRIGWREDLQGPCISWRNHRFPHVSSRFSLRPTHWMISPKCHAQSSVPRAPRRYDGTPTSTCSDLGLAGTSFVNGAFAMGKYGKIIERHGKLWDFHWTKPGVGNCPILGILDITWKSSH